MVQRSTKSTGANESGESAESGGAVEPASVFERVSAFMERIRPAIQSDGGDVELVEVTSEGVARIRFHGACVGCPSSNITLQMGIERNLCEKIPEVTAVEQVL